MTARSTLAAIVISAAIASPAPAQTAAELLQKGVYTQDTIGDLDAALRIYRQVVATPSAQRAPAAQAQVRIVQCLLEKGGAKSAAREFDKLTRDFAEFKELIAAARARLGAADARERVALTSGPTRILSAVRGTVRDASGRPLRRAQIRVSAPELAGEPRTTNTDEAGLYELINLPAPRYTMIATRNGYLPLRHGQRRPLELGRPLQLLDGQVIERVDFVLPRMGVISGRITDETGDPIADVLVLPMRSPYSADPRQFVPIGPGPLVRTDEDGEYRLAGLAPGTYVVMAQTAQRWPVDDAGSNVMSYATTYFPGTTAIGDARRVTVGIGQETSRIDFPLSLARTARLSGTARDSRGRPFKQVMLAMELRGEGIGLFGAAARVDVGGEGRFTLLDVQPGHYKLQATTLQSSGPGDGPPEFAVLAVDVNGVDLDNLTLTGSTGGSVSGRIVADSGGLPDLNRVHLTVAERMMGQPEPLRIGTFGPAAGFGRVEPHPDGTFTLDHVVGRARAEVVLPDGWALKAILHDGRDISDAPIELKSGERLDDVTIVLTRRVTTVAGQVLGGGGAPTSDGTVLVFAADRGKWFEQSRFVRAVRPDQDGRYQVAGLPPGAYQAIAIDDVEDGAWADPDYLEALRPSARAVTLAEGQTQTAALTLIKR